MDMKLTALYGHFIFMKRSILWSLLVISLMSMIL